MASGRLHPFSPRRRPPLGRLEIAFHLVRAFVSRAKQSLAWTKLSVGCREIILFRKIHPGRVGERSLMHTFHDPNTICALSLVERLPGEHLIGLLLHEFGHLGSGGGEREADRWILDNFGIRILYMGDLDLEWVDYASIAKIVTTVTPPRRRNPRPGRRLHPRRRLPLPALPTSSRL